MLTTICKALEARIPSELLLEYAKAHQCIFVSFVLKLVSVYALAHAGNGKENRS